VRTVTRNGIRRLSTIKKILEAVFEGNYNVYSIAKKVHLDEPMVHDYIVWLISQGYLKRITEVYGRRIKRIYLTGKGYKLLLCLRIFDELMKENVTVEEVEWVYHAVKLRKWYRASLHV